MTKGKSVKKTVKKRPTKEEYIKKAKRLAKNNGVTIITKLENRDKVILSTKIKVYHPVCDKTRPTTLGVFLKLPECRYCSKVSRVNSLKERRMKVYSDFPKPKKGQSKSLPVPKITKYGELSKPKRVKNEGASKGEQEVQRVLEELRVDFKVEVPIFLNKHSKRPLRADFMVYKDGKKYIIEYDGEQHFRSIKAYGGRKGLNRRWALDEAKDNYVKRTKDMDILRIPYWESKNIEYHVRKYLNLL